MSNQTIHSIVVGTGRMGQHHAKCWAERVPGAQLTAVVDQDIARAEQVANANNASAYNSIDAALDAHPEISVATLAVPTTAHSTAAAPLFARGIHTLIEKPLAATIEEANKIAQAAKAADVVARVGHVERFNPAFRALIALNWTPRMVITERVSHLPLRSLDIGVNMDLGIHDIDLLTALYQRYPTNIMSSKLSQIDPTGEKEDMCNAWLQYGEDQQAQLTISRLHVEPKRQITMIAKEGIASVNLGERTGRFWAFDAHKDLKQYVNDTVEAGLAPTDWNYTSRLIEQTLNVAGVSGPQDPLAAQALGLLDAIAGKPSLNVSCENAAQAVHIAQQL